VLQAVYLALGGVAGQRRVEILAGFLAQDAQVPGLIFGHLLIGIAHAQIVRRGRLRSRSGVAAVDPETLPVLGGSLGIAAMHGVPVPLGIALPWLSFAISSVSMLRLLMLIGVSAGSDDALATPAAECLFLSTARAD